MRDHAGNPGTHATYSRLEAARESRARRYESAMRRHDRTLGKAVAIVGVGLGVAVLYSVVKK